MTPLSARVVAQRYGDRIRSSNWRLAGAVCSQASRLIP